MADLDWWSCCLVGNACVGQRISSSATARRAAARLSEATSVFALCDAKNCGHLGRIQLLDALMCFGLKPGVAELDAALSSCGFDVKEGRKELTGECGHIDVDVALFTKLVAALSESLPAAQRCRRAVPHALRGMELGQLREIERIYIQSGWLEQMCADYNKKHEAEIQASVRYQQAPNLYAIDEYIVRPITHTGASLAREMDLAGFFPNTNDKINMAELLNPCGNICHFFVSHFWGHLFSSTMKTLTAFATQHLSLFGLGSPKEMTYWICLFALNQHCAAEEVGTDPMYGPFNAALRHAEAGAVMVVDKSLEPFRRVWCLFEVHRIFGYKMGFQLACERGALTKLRSLSVTADEQAETYALISAVGDGLMDISVTKANTSKLIDKQRILYALINQDWRRFPMQVLIDEGRFDDTRWFVTFDGMIKGLLAQDLLCASLEVGDMTSAIKWGIQGADFDASILRRLNTDEESKAEMLRASCRLGKPAQVKLLLEEKANVVAADARGLPPLHWACFNGGTEVVAMVLAAGPQLEFTCISGCPAIMHATCAGNVEALKMVLAARANIDAINICDGGTSMMWGSRYGQLDTVRFLLENRASPNAKAFKGETALTLATKNEHEDLVKLLKEWGVQEPMELSESPPQQVVPGTQPAF